MNYLLLIEVLLDRYYCKRVVVIDLWLEVDCVEMWFFFNV